MNEIQLKQRTKRFALDAITVVDQLPATTSGRVVGNQLLRAATSVGANYRAACRGRSGAEFVAKLGIVEEEADESAFWCELLMESRIRNCDDVRELWREADELTAIAAASRITASRNNRKSKIANRKSP